MRSLRRSNGLDDRCTSAPSRRSWSLQKYFDAYTIYRSRSTKA
ncbi:MAG TPA: hypothetical protein VLD67_03255 [Vicinamibacterales bacterium]|nr:hypothetical protein [Vicinamibacterales bacterium]